MAKPKTKDDIAADEERAGVLESIQKWTPEQLLEVKHLGPGIIGEEMYKAAQAYNAKTDGGKFGPAILGIVPEQNKSQLPKKKDA